MKRTTITLALAWLVSGCSSPDDPDAVVGPVQAPPSFAEGELVIEVEPRTSKNVMPIVPPASSWDVIEHTEPITLALGAEYPDAIDVTLKDLFHTCMLDVTYEIDSVAAAAGVSADQVEPATITVGADTEGDFSVVLSGRATYDATHPCAPEAGDGDVDFEITLSVIAREPARVAVTPPDWCTESAVHYIESGARLSTDWIPLNVSLEDAAGERFYPANASSARPITLTVRGAPGTLLGLHDPSLGLGGLVAKGAPGSITIESTLGEAFEFELIGPESIDEMDVAFDLMGLAGGGFYDMETGQTYGPQFARTSSSIDVAVHGLYVNDERICTAPAPLSLQLATTTPTICPVFAEVGHGDHAVGEQAGVSAEVIESGTCALELTAPAFADGDGLRAELSVTFVGAENLLDVGEGR